MTHLQMQSMYHFNDTYKTSLTHAHKSHILQVCLDFCVTHDLKLIMLTHTHTATKSANKIFFIDSKLGSFEKQQ